MEPDLDLGRRFLAANPPPGRVLLCAVTGSHQYGFPSADSDLDLKGIHLAPTERALSLWPPLPAFDRLEVFEGTECDLTTNELRQALTLLLRGNGNMLERITSPHQLVDGPEVAALRALVPLALSRRVAGHYRGFLRAMQQEARRVPRAKTLLYAWRVGLTGLHLLTTGQIEANLPRLAPLYGWPELEELVRRKVSGAEKGELPAAEVARWTAGWPELEERLERAVETSPLPEEPPDADAIDAWQVALRLAR